MAQLQGERATLEQQADKHQTHRDTAAKQLKVLQGRAEVRVVLLRQQRHSTAPGKALARQLAGERDARATAQQQLSSAGQQVEELRGQHAQLVARLVAAQQELDGRAGALARREEEVADLQAALQGW